MGVPCAILGIVLGFVGLRKASELGGSGRGMAIAGLTCGAVSLLLVIVFVIIVASVINDTENFFESIQALRPLV